ncbi:hypothetical protein H5410_000158, partial [Solanum commersonii]
QQPTQSHNNVQPIPNVDNTTIPTAPKQRTCRPLHPPDYHRSSKLVRIWVAAQVSHWLFGSRLCGKTRPLFASSQSRCPKKFIEYILQNVMDLFMNKNELDKFVLLKKEFQVLEESLKYLKTFLNFIKDANMELEKSRMLFDHVEVVTQNAAYICYLRYVEEVDNDLASSLRVKISNVLQDIKPLDPHVSEIYTGALRGLVKFQIQYIRDVKEFVEGFVQFLFKDLLELSNGEAYSLMFPLINDLYHASKQLGKLSGILTCIESLIAEVASAAYSFSVDKAAEVNSVFADLLKKIDSVMEDVKDVILEAPLSSQCNYPRTNGLGFIDSLLRYLKDLLQDGKCDSVVKHLIAESQEELYLLRSFMEKFE